jgi:hypothetical protein
MVFAILSVNFNRSIGTKHRKLPVILRKELSLDYFVIQSTDTLHTQVSEIEYTDLRRVRAASGNEVLVLTDGNTRAVPAELHIV